MPNSCAVDMKITGNKAAVEEMVAMLGWTGKFERVGLGRSFSFEVVEFNKAERPGVWEAVCYGDYADSIKAALLSKDGLRHPSLESESGRLNVAVEAFSSEMDGGFQEHIYVVNGKVLEEECVPYAEHFVEGVGGVERYNTLHGTEFTPDMVNVNGEVCIGGFGDKYGCFREVDDVIRDVAARLVEDINDVYGVYVTPGLYEQVVDGFCDTLNEVTPVRLTALVKDIKAISTTDELREKGNVLIDRMVKWSVGGERLRDLDKGNVGCTTNFDSRNRGDER